MNVFDTLSQAARQWPGRPAVIDAAGSLDYQSLWREIESLRAQLARLDVRKGHGVGVRARNGRGFIIGALAALGCGATVMPIHHQLKPDELADLLARAPLGAILDDGCGTGQGGKTRGLELPGGIALRFIKNDGHLMAGLTAHASASVKASGIVVPSSAVVQSSGASYVFVIEDGVASKRLVIWPQTPAT